VWWLAPLMFMIEVCSHLARILSLTVRLFANMFAGDMVTLVFFSLVPIGIPVIFLILHFGVSLIQTLIFVLLPMVYIGEAVARALKKVSGTAWRLPSSFVVRRKREGLPLRGTSTTHWRRNLKEQ
jgi:hypothetical protein